jgi:DNA-directed RNA polymerase specialized sigma24 family protein
MTPVTTTTKIIQEVRSGNLEIIAQFYEQYRDEFIGWAQTRFSIDKDDAKDILQECLLSFYNAIIDGKLTEVKVSIKTFLFLCCKDKIVNLGKCIN